MLIWIRRRLPPLLWGIGSTLAVATAAAELTFVHPHFELFAHFRHAYAVVALLCGIGFVWRKLPAPGTVLLLIALWHLSFVLPWYVAGESPECPADQRLRIMSANILKSNDDPRPVEAIIERQNPDIIVLSEYSRGFQRNFDEVRAEYPHRFEETRGFLSGVAIFSKSPLGESTLRTFGADGPPQLETSVTVGGESIAIWGVHPLPPVTPRLMTERNRVLEGLARAVEASSTPNILVGDFNTTMWSDIYRALEARDLRNARDGHGIAGTWPAIPLFPFKLPIDHIMYSTDLDAVDFQVAPSIGSDHHPVLADICLP